MSVPHTRFQCDIAGYVVHTIGSIVEKVTEAVLGVFIYIEACHHPTVQTDVPLYLPEAAQLLIGAAEQFTDATGVSELGQGTLCIQLTAASVSQRVW
jgi:hypothetical protein